MSYVEEENGTMVGKGVAFEVLKFLTEKFNFTIKLVNITSNIIGSSDDKNGSIIEAFEKSVNKLKIANRNLLKLEIYFSSDNNKRSF